jgi:ribose 5-phosphate isomerase
MLILGGYVHKGGMVIGLGFGYDYQFAIQYLGRQICAGALKDVVGGANVSSLVVTTSETTDVL